MYSKKESAEKAKQILFSRKNNAISTALMRKEQITNENEKIAKALKNKNSLAYEYFVTYVAKSGEKELNRIKKEQVENDILLDSLFEKAGLPPDYLEPPFFCIKCRDSGYLPDGRYCECYKKLVGSIMCKSFNSTINAEKYSFDSFSLEYYPDDLKNQIRLLMKMNLEFCKEYAKNFDPKKIGGILMTGNTGLGKTHLSLAIANVVLQKGFSVIYDSAQNLFDKISNERFGKNNYDDNTEYAAYNSDLLIIDDLGCEYNTPFLQSSVYNLLNKRMLIERPTIINTNLSISELAERYSDRLISRIAGTYRLLHFEGNDIRLLKKSALQK